MRRLITFFSFVAYSPVLLSQDKTERIEAKAFYETVLERIAADSCKPESQILKCLEKNKPLCVSEVKLVALSCIHAQKTRIKKSHFSNAEGIRLAEELIDCSSEKWTNLVLEKQRVACLPAASSIGPDLATQYASELNAEIERVRKLKDNFSRNRSLLCLGYSGTDASGCMQEVLQTLKINSSGSLNLIMALVLEVGLRDLKVSGSRSAEMKLAENAILVFERTTPSQFFINSLKPANGDDATALRILRKAENESLTRTKETIISQIEQLLLIQRPRSPTNSGPEGPKLSELKVRLEQVKLKKWELP